MPNVITIANAFRRWQGDHVDSHQRWIASREHFELERLRVESPERYQQLYPLVVHILQNVRIRDITD